MGRVFENESGDWKTVDKLLKEAEPYPIVIKELVQDLVKAIQKYKEFMFEAYRAAPKVDCLYYDSPISPANQTHYLKAYMKKAGWDGIKDIHAATIDIEDFDKRMNEAMRWLTKYKNENKN